MWIIIILGCCSCRRFLINCCNDGVANSLHFLELFIIIFLWTFGLSSNHLKSLLTSFLIISFLLDSNVWKIVLVIDLIIRVIHVHTQVVSGLNFLSSLLVFLCKLVTLPDQTSGLLLTQETFVIANCDLSSPWGLVFCPYVKCATLVKFNVTSIWGVPPHKSKKKVFRFWEDSY